jgi:hypothetical protein
VDLEREKNMKGQDCGDLKGTWVVKAGKRHWIPGSNVVTTKNMRVVLMMTVAIDAIMCSTVQSATRRPKKNRTSADSTRRGSEDTMRGTCHPCNPLYRISRTGKASFGVRFSYRWYSRSHCLHRIPTRTAVIERVRLANQKELIQTMAGSITNL